VGIGLREAGRLTLLADKQSTDLWARRIIDYVVNRQNEDGGYTFCQGIESNAQDTYYVLAILDLLGVPFPNVEKTVEWLQSFVPDSLYSHYYVAKALKLCSFLAKTEIPMLLSSFGTISVNINSASLSKSIMSKPPVIFIDKFSQGFPTILLAKLPTWKLLTNFLRDFLFTISFLFRPFF
jgi:hypothetical protein